MWKIVLAGVIVVGLGGCSASSRINLLGSGIERVRGYVDGAIKAAEAKSDDLLNATEGLEDILRVELARLEMLKCRFPYTALIRRAQRSPEDRVMVLQDCGLDVAPLDSRAIMLPPQMRKGILREERFQ